MIKLIRILVFALCIFFGFDLLSWGACNVAEVSSEVCSPELSKHTKDQFKFIMKLVHNLR